MKFLFAFLLALIVLPAFAEPLSDRTGLKTNFSIQSNGETYVVESIANFDVRNISFINNTLLVAINSSIEKNIGEFQVPNEIIQGDLKFLFDGQEITPKVLKNERISFITLEFTGNGTHTLEISNDYTSNEQEETPIETTNQDDHLIVILAVIGIIIAGGAGSTLAVYFKRKKA